MDRWLNKWVVINGEKYFVYARDASGYYHLHDKDNQDFGSHVSDYWLMENEKRNSQTEWFKNNLKG